MNDQKQNKEYISRLMAVQACYQGIYNKKAIKLVIDEYLEDGLKTDDEPEDGQEQEALPEEVEAIKILPHGGLLKKILLGLEERRDEIEDIVKAHITSPKDVEPLLYSILLCGVCELLQHIKTDTPIIVNDYLNVTHEFYPKSQVSFVNGILDSAAKTLRD
jgi:N utilization substance protein B